MAQTPNKINATLNRQELKQLREIMRDKYRDTVVFGKDSLILKRVDATLKGNRENVAVDNVDINDLLKIAETYLQDFIDVETKKKGRNSFLRIMKQIRQQDTNLRTLTNSDGYIYQSREFVPLILDILDKEKQ